MKIIIGLGNPGKEYENTRHNAGFMAVDKMKDEWSFPDFEFNKKFNAEISKGRLDGVEMILAKPRTFMNLSGEAVKAILDFYKSSPDDLIIIHDDLDILIGKYKLASDSSSAGHNGIKDIIEKLGTQKFRRFRIGIKNTGVEPDNAKKDARDFVMGKFQKEELETIGNILAEISSKPSGLL